MTKRSTEVAFEDDLLQFEEPRAVQEDRTAWEPVYALFYSLAGLNAAPTPSDFKQTVETGVRNGDCLAACFATVLEVLHRGKITSRTLHKPAAEMRETVVAWIKENWLNTPVFNDQMKMHELVCLAHDVGIQESERDEFGMWGDGPQSRFAKYSSQCSQIYFAEPEILAFSCMMHEKGTPMCFRVWRSLPRNRAFLVQTIPDPESMIVVGVTEAVVVDLLHSGERDGRTAHYRFLDSASLLNLCEVEPAPHRRRIVPD